MTKRLAVTTGDLTVATPQSNGGYIIFQDTGLMGHTWTSVGYARNRDEVLNFYPKATVMDAEEFVRVCSRPNCLRTDTNPDRHCPEHAEIP